MNAKETSGKEHLAVARALNLPISTKHSIEISRTLRYKTTAFAKAFLEDVIAMDRPVPFRTFNKDMGHKKGMTAGRYPEKAAREFLKLVNSVEANAQFKGLNTAQLKITKILANLASIPMSGGRSRTATKRSNIEIEVKELSQKKADASKSTKAAKPVQREKSQSGKDDITKDDGKKAAEVKKQEHPTEKHQPSSSSVHPAPSHLGASQGAPSAAPVQTTPVQTKEPSPEALLKKVQERAAQMNKKTTTELGKVETLLTELQKKGTLRGSS